MSKNQIASPHHPITPSPRLAIIGLGYVGLPLARLFATKFPVIGFDTKQEVTAEPEKLKFQ